MKFKIGQNRTLLLLCDVMHRHGWKRTQGDDWQLYWGWHLPDNLAELAGPRSCNHLPGANGIAAKGSFSTLIEHARLRAARHGDDRRWRFVPRTFRMPHELDAFRAAAAADPEAVWIIKPPGAHGGKGVSLLLRPEDAPLRPGWLVQQYLRRAHLLDGRKYSIRTYLLTTSLDPLVAYLYRDGLVKRMTLPYSDAPEDRANRLYHLSNSDVQKLAPGGLLPRLQFGAYRDLLAAKGADYDVLWRKIRRICALTLIAGREQMLRAGRLQPLPRATLFNLWGPDILVDEHLDPWMVECNGNPGLGVTSQVGLAGYDEEHAQKTAVIEEALQLTGVLAPGPAGGQPPRQFGGWELLFPAPEAADWAADWFPRRKDRQLFARLGFAPPAVPRVPTPAGAVLVEDGLLHYADGRNRLVALNAAATSILFLHQEGLTSEEIAAKLAAANPSLSPDDALDTVESTLAEVWAIDVPDKDPAPKEEKRIPSLAATDVAVMRTYAIGPVTLRVRFGPGAFSAAVDDILAHLRIDDRTEAAEEIDVIATASGPGLRVCSAGEMIFARRPDRLASALHSALLHRACAASGVTTALHAGAVARGGRCLILAGSSGAGKSTLTAALTLAGFDYLSDEAAILDANQHVRPAPVALGLTPQAAALLATRIPDGRLLPECRRRDHTTVRFLRPGPVATAPAPVAALIFPTLAPGEPARLLPLGPAAALERLSRTGLELRSRPAAEAAAALIDWLRRTPAFELRHHALDESVALLTAFADSPGPRA